MKYYYATAWFCVECRVEVSDHTRMYSNGRCPHCGFKGKSACTIMETIEKSVKRESKEKLIDKLFTPTGLTIIFTIGLLAGLLVGNL